LLHRLLLDSLLLVIPEAAREPLFQPLETDFASEIRELYGAASIRQYQSLAFAKHCEPFRRQPEVEIGP
jgi:hypothetical protein